jgi:type IV pilus assembly protein PilB
MNDPGNSSSGGDVERVQELARRYRCEFEDLRNFKLNPDFLKRVPAELMFRYNFLPLEETDDGRLAIALADPSQLLLIDEISLLLGRRLIVRVAALARINEPPSPSPDAPVCAPKKPGPHLRSSCAKAFPEEDQ